MSPPSFDARTVASGHVSANADARYSAAAVQGEASDGRRRNSATIIAGPSMPAAPIAATIVALGDSTTAGTPGFQSPIEAPPDGRGDVESQYAYWLMKTHPDWRVLNRGVNGQRTDQIRARFEHDVLLAKPNAVVIIAGVNDVYQGRGADAVTHELESM